MALPLVFALWNYDTNPLWYISGTLIDLLISSSGNQNLNQALNKTVGLLSDAEKVSEPYHNRVRHWLRPAPDPGENLSSKGKQALLESLEKCFNAVENSKFNSTNQALVESTKGFLYDLYTYTKHS